MIDNLSVLLSCGAILLVAWRAIRLDATRPWFSGQERAPTRRLRR